MTQLTRKKHIDESKVRALEYVELNDLMNAINSLSSDLLKHPETREHGAIELSTMLMIRGHLSTPEAVRKFIDDVA